MRHPAWFAGLLVFTTGCGPEADNAVIGQILPASWGADVTRVAQAVVDSVYGGRPRFRSPPPGVFTGGSADTEVAYAEDLVTVAGLVAVVGHGGSRESLAAAPVYNGAGVVHIVPTGTSSALRSAGPWTFMLAPDDSLEGEFIADALVREHGARSVGIFYVRDEYGEGLRDAVASAVGRRGGTVPEAIPLPVTGDVAVIAEAFLARHRPDAVVVAARPVATALLARALARLAPRTPIIAGDGAFVFPQLLNELGPARENVSVVGFWDPRADDPGSAAFRREFARIVGGEPHPSHAMAYDAMMLLARAVQDVGAAPEDIRTYLRELGGERPAYRGVTGDITFEAHRAPRFVLVDLRDWPPVP